MEAFGAKIRASREMAEIWAAKLGSAPSSDVGKLLLEFVKTMAFETSMSLADGADPVEPKALGQLALVAQRLEAAARKSPKVPGCLRKPPPISVARFWGSYDGRTIVSAGTVT